MRYTFIIGSFLCLACVFSAERAQAFVSPLSLSLVPPIEFPSEDFTVGGLRLSILWGEHRSVYGFDFGAVGNITEQDFGGMAVSGGFNSTNGQATIVGFQIAGIANVNMGKLSMYGVQVAAVNYNKGEAGGFGVMAGLLGNISPDLTFGGIQVGLYNRALTMYGFQIGLVNVVDNLHGLQIGLVNFNRNGPFAVSPILNVGF